MTDVDCIKNVITVPQSDWEADRREKDYDRFEKDMVNLEKYMFDLKKEVSK